MSTTIVLNLFFHEKNTNITHSITGFSKVELRRGGKYPLLSGGNRKFCLGKGIFLSGDGNLRSSDFGHSNLFKS